MKIIFVDFDKTLIQKESGVICALPGFKKGLISFRYLIRLIGSAFLYKLKIKTRAELQRVGFEFYGGHRKEELKKLIHLLWHQLMKNFLSPSVMAEIKAHREQGNKIVILTAAAQVLVEPLLEDLQMDDIIGTTLEFKEEVCTGRVLGPIVEGKIKKEYAEAYSAQAGLTLTDCVFYSDHSADLPLLEAVGTPIAVSPNSILKKVALQRGWRVLEHSFQHNLELK